jgi:hypothetical protein
MAIAQSLANVPNLAGSGNGSPVSISLASAFVDSFGNGVLPSLNYSVLITPSQSCWASVSGKTSSGFTVTLTPDSGVTLAAGSFDVLVHT